VLVVLAGFPEQSPVPAVSAPDVRSSWYRGRWVTYEVRNGLAIYQGDIVLGTAEELETARVQAEKASGVTAASSLWPGGLVPYALDANLTPALRNSILEAIAHWSTKTPLRFVERTTESSYVRFVRDAGSGLCTSSIGRIGGQQHISLDDGCTTGNIIHEIGHTVGLWHEQSRADRDNFVEVLYQNIDKRYTYNFDLELANEVDLGPYDFASIMHYGAYNFSRNGRPTIETIPPGIPIGGREELSPGDVDAIRRLYGQPAATTTIATHPAGLEVIVDGVPYFAPATFNWISGSRHTINVPSPQGGGPVRYVFGRWSDEGDQLHEIIASPSITLITASFIKQHQIDTAVSPAGAGLVRIWPASSSGFFADRAEIELSAEPAAGYGFLRWTGWQSGSENPKRVIVSRYGTLGASFTRSAVTTVASDPPGLRVLVDGSPYTVPYNFEWAPGSVHTLSAPSPQTAGLVRYQFEGWDGGATGALTVVASDKPAVYTARFMPHYLVTTAAEPSPAGYVTLSPEFAGGYYPRGTFLTFSSAPRSGYLFDYWSGDLGGTSNPAQLTVNDQLSITARFRTPSRETYAVVNAASYAPTGVAPGEIVAIFGENLGPATPVLLQLDSDGKVKTQLGGTRVYFDGVAAPLISVSATQIGAVAPYSLAGRSVTQVRIERPGFTFPLLAAAVREAAPGIFSLDMSGRGSGAILNEDGVTVNSPASPALRGSVVSIFATGCGTTDPPGEDGSVPVGVLPKPRLPVRVTIGGASAKIEYAGAAPHYVSGVLQINARVPKNIDPGDHVPVVLYCGPYSSLPAITMAVR